MSENILNTNNKKIIKGLKTFLLAKKIINSDNVDDIIMKFYNDGYSLVNQVQTLHNRILNDNNYSCNKIKMCKF